jgi:hypothetical protein
MSTIRVRWMQYVHDRQVGLELDRWTQDTEDERTRSRGNRAHAIVKYSIYSHALIYTMCMMKVGMSLSYPAVPLTLLPVL